MKDTIDVSVRSSPRYSAFITLGVLAGLLLGVVLWIIPKDTSSLSMEFSPLAMGALIMLLCAGIGGFVGAAVALILDRIGLKRARRYTVNAEFEATQREAAEADGADEDDVTGASAAQDPRPTDQEG